MMILLPLIARYGSYLALIAGLSVVALTWDRSRIAKGVEKERVRVETIGETTDARAQEAVRTARKRAEAKPDEALLRYCRDCNPK